MIKLTVKNFEKHLNEIGKDFVTSKFVIGGKFRKSYYPNKYGRALKKHDPINFNVQFNEWKRNNRRKW